MNFAALKIGKLKTERYKMKTIWMKKNKTQKTIN